MIGIIGSAAYSPVACELEHVGLLAQLGRTIVRRADSRIKEPGLRLAERLPRIGLESLLGIRREGDAPLSVVLVLLVLRPPRCVALKVRKVLLSGKDVTATARWGTGQAGLARISWS